MCYAAAAAGGEKRGGVGGKRSQRGEGRVTSDPADRQILSFQWPPLSLLFTSLKECKKRAGRNNEATPGGDEMEAGEEKEEERQSKGVINK